MIGVSEAKYKTSFLRLSVVIALGLGFFFCSMPFMHAEARSLVTRSISGNLVGLTVPNLYCPMKNNIPTDKLLLDALKVSLGKGNELLLQFANCEELKMWRAGKLKYLNNYGSYQTSKGLKSIDMRGRERATIREVCNLYKKQGAAQIQSLTKEIENRLIEGLKFIQLNEMKVLGIVYEDETICTMAMYQRLRANDKTIKTQLTILSATILNGRLVFSYLYAPFDDKTKITKLTKQMLYLNLYNQKRNNQHSIK